METRARFSGPLRPGFGLMLALTFALGAQEVVINEIMYHPPGDLDLAQYVELYNRNSRDIDLTGWAFTKGIQFQFPPGSRLSANGYLVICRDLKVFTTHYGRSGSLLAGFTNRLSHSGERIELCDAHGQTVDALQYGDAGDWPTAPDGYSASLERISPNAPALDVANWASSRLRSPSQPGGTPGRRNDSFSANVPPAIATIETTRVLPDTPVTVRAAVGDPDNVGSVTLLYTVITGQRESAEAAVAMQRISGDGRQGNYEGILPAQPAQRLVRWRIRAMDAQGAVRVRPSPQEPRPTFTYSTFLTTNVSTVPFGLVLRLASVPERNGGRRTDGASAAFGNAVFLHIPAGGGPAEVFDHVGVTPRRGGFKVRFQKDRMLDGVSTWNIVSEGPPRYLLSEALAYELFRLAGVPAPRAGHVQLWENGRPQGLHLTFEQPNGSFLRRHRRSEAGTLYKAMYGNYELRRNPRNTTGELESVVRELHRRSGADQWRWIEANFQVDEVTSFFAVCQCIQNWDGYFNNHYAFHDVGGSGRWELYPWDLDKTWGDYDGASPDYDWYSMPLTYGMDGDPGVGTSWWRGPGSLSGPLLANAEFRTRFLSRLREVCETVFTPARFGPVIEALETRLGTEIEARARAFGEDPADARRQFHRDVQSFRNQLQHRREFILRRLSPKSP